MLMASSSKQSMRSLTWLGWGVEGEIPRTTMKKHLYISNLSEMQRSWTYKQAACEETSFLCHDMDGQVTQSCSNMSSPRFSTIPTGAVWSKPPPDQEVHIPRAVGWSGIRTCCWLSAGCFRDFHKGTLISKVTWNGGLYIESYINQTNLGLFVPHWNECCAAKMPHFFHHPEERVCSTTRSSPYSVLYHGCSYLASWPWLLMICPAIFGAQHLSISLKFILTHRTQLSCRSSNSWPIKTIPLHGRTCAVPLAESFQDLFKLGGLIDGTGRDLKHALQSGNFRRPQSFNDGLGCIALEFGLGYVYERYPGIPNHQPSVK